MADGMSERGPDAASARGAEKAAGIGVYPWLVAGILSLGYLASVLDRYIMSVALEPLKADLALSDFDLGILTGVSFVLLFSVASLPLGWLADVASRRWIIILGILCWSGATIACGFATTFRGLFVARLGVGLGEAALVPAAMSLLAAYFTRDTLTKGVAVFTMGSSLGRATAFIGGGALLALLTTQGGLSLPVLGTFRPWQGLFIAAGALGLIVAALCLLIREPARTVNPRGGSVGIRPAIDWFAANFRLYIRLFIIQGMIIGIATALAMWMISFYVRKHGLAVEQASMIVGTTSLIFGPAGALLGGWLTDRLVRRGVPAAVPLVLTGILLVGPVAGLMFVLSQAVLVTIAAYCILYVAVVASGPATFGGLQLITPPQYRGFISSLFLVVYTLIGAGGGPTLIGFLNDYVYRDEAAIDLSIATMLVVCAIIGVPLALSVRQSYQAAIERNR